MELNPTYQAFAATFAQAIMAKNFGAAHGLLAPWLQSTLSSAQLAERIQAEVQLTLDASQIEGDFHPQDYAIGWNTCQLSDLLEPRSYAPQREIVSEITTDNFRQWMKVQFLPTEEEAFELDIDAYMDFWMILVDIDGDLKVGYFEIEEPD